MAQISIREYDVKKMFYESIAQEYSGIQIREISDIEKLEDKRKYVIKPDMLFGQRGKRGLVGINLDKIECKKWLTKYFHKQENIDGVDGTLDVFLTEEVVDINKEYYLSFAQSRDGDIITFSLNGGVNIEDNWDSALSITVSVHSELTHTNIKTLIGPTLSGDTVFVELIIQLWRYYRSHGYVLLEFNPIAQDAQGVFHIIDAVAKIDDQEEYLQKENWNDLEIPNTYGFSENAGERYIRELDNQTGASLKMKILNPNARIWTLFAGGGGSLVMTDTLGALGYANDIGNYGECSGNPSREFTREYSKTLLGEMLKNKKQGKCLIIAGAIANFTHIDTTFTGVIDAIEENIKEIREQKVTILVRRGGINEERGLQILSDACARLQIPAIIKGSDTYMTDILLNIKI